MKIKLGEEEIDLDEDNLIVSESNMNEFLKKFAGIYNYYNNAWAKSQYLNHAAEDRYDALYNEKFTFYKENGGASDKLAEAKAKANEEVQAAKKSVRNSKYIMQLLFTYLRALDKAQENALNLGYNIRKEMDKIFPQAIKGMPANHSDADHEVSKLFSNLTV